MISPVIEYRDLLKRIKDSIYKNFSGHVLFSFSNYSSKLTDFQSCSIFEYGGGSSRDKIPPNHIGIASKVTNGLKGIPLKEQVFGTLFNLDDSLIIRCSKDKVYVCLDTSKCKFANHTDVIYYIAAKYLVSNLLIRYLTTYPIKDCFKEEDLNDKSLNYINNVVVLAENMSKIEKSSSPEITSIFESDATRILKEIDEEFRDRLNKCKSWEDKEKYLHLIVTLIGIDPYKYARIDPIPFVKCYKDLADIIYRELANSRVLISSTVREALKEESLYLRDNLLPLVVISEGTRTRKSTKSDSPYSIRYRILDCHLSLMRYRTGRVEKSIDGYKKLIKECDRIFNESYNVAYDTEMLKIFNN